MIGVHSFVLLHLANGPLWKHMMVQESENCRENWWTNIMFINNYVNADRPVSEKPINVTLMYKNMISGESNEIKR